MVEHYLAKVVTRVRFPSPAPDAQQATKVAFFIRQRGFHLHPYRLEHPTSFSNH